MRVPIEAIQGPADGPDEYRHHPLKMRVPIEAGTLMCAWQPEYTEHHPLKMRVPIEAGTHGCFGHGSRVGITL